MYASFDGYEIPKVYDVQEQKQHIGESARTAAGKLRRDTIASKRSWTIKCRAVPKSKLDLLLYHLQSTLYAEGAFWLYEFGDATNTVQAMIDPESITLKTVGVADENGVWHMDGKELSLTVEEV